MEEGHCAKPTGFFSGVFLGFFLGFWHLDARASTTLGDCEVVWEEATDKEVSWELGAEDMSGEREPTQYFMVCHKESS